VVPGGGISPDGKRWIVCHPGFFLPVRVLSRLFRRLFLQHLQAAFAQGKLQFFSSLERLREPQAFAQYLAPLRQTEWVVYAKPPFGGPEQVLNYLGRYTHRVAISNHRLVTFTDGKVTFRWKDYAHGGKSRLMTLSADEFLRRFLLHVLPRGFVRIRFFGLLANRRRAALLPLCRMLIHEGNPRSYPTQPPPLQSTQSSGSTCPLCGGPMVVIERLTAVQLLSDLAGQVAIADTS